MDFKACPNFHNQCQGYSEQGQNPIFTRVTLKFSIMELMAVRNAKGKVKGQTPHFYYQLKMKSLGEIEYFLRGEKRT